MKLAVIAGDGIGPEVVTEAVKMRCLRVVAEAYAHDYRSAVWHDLLPFCPQ